MHIIDIAPEDCCQSTDPLHDARGGIGRPAQASPRDAFLPQLEAHPAGLYAMLRIPSCTNRQQTIVLQTE